MRSSPLLPSADEVRSARKQFDQANETVEKAITELFGQYPKNTVASHVLLKVVVLNRLYSTGIMAVTEMADHIFNMGDEIDSALAQGSPEIVSKIAPIKFKAAKGVITWLSFATKYCSWHRRDLYPIYDSRVEAYLWWLKKQGHFQPEVFKKREDLWRYPTFRQIIIALRDQFELGEFSFKEIDKFLWSQGELLMSRTETVPKVVGEIASDIVVEFDGEISDESEHAPMLSNEMANRLADRPAVEQARTLGLTEEEIAHLIVQSE